jgi:hypothetical protein
MKMKIFIGFILLFLIIGTVSTVTAINLEIPMGYEKEIDGYYHFVSDEEQHLYIGDMDVNNDIFKNATNYKVSNIGNNLYTFEDTELNSYGIQEKVTINGTDYLVSIDKKTPLTDRELSTFKDDLMSFNKLNKVKAMPI